MTEQEWSECEEAIPMLDLLADAAHDRQLRRFACLCCRQNWKRLTDPRSQRAVEVAEAYVDGKVSRQDLKDVAREAEAARKEACGATQLAAWVATLTTLLTYAPFGTNDLGLLADWATLGKKQRGRQQCQWLRELFGNPLRPVVIEPTWLSWNHSSIRQIANVIHTESRFQDMPILADALEEAGCTDAAILAHCRGPGPHVRGCWVIDLLLGKG